MTAADFSMQDKSTVPFGWIAEDNDYLSELVETGNRRAMEAYVREYVRGEISKWLEMNTCRAKAQTIYRVWRGGVEFDAIVNYILS